MKNICPVCGTENEEEYLFCKNCGTPLTSETENRSEHTSDFASTYGNVYSGAVCGQTYPEVMGGVPSADIALFVGKQADKIYPKFAKMYITDTKTSWCWPVAILSFLFGPFGAAFWLFYRKMYKEGTILATIGTVVLGMTGFLNAEFGTPLDIGMTGAQTVSAYPPALLFYFVIRTVCAVWCGLYGYWWYYKTTCARISKYRNSGADMRYYQFALASIGGTSGGMVAIMLIICIVISMCFNNLFRYI